MWKFDASLRLVRWRDFRQGLANKSVESALEETAQLWNTAPFTPYYLDPEHVDNWPDPWSLITNNCYCDLAKALGIIYTVSLSKHGENFDTELCIYQDTETGYVYNLAIFEQGKYVINLIPRQVVNKSFIGDSLKLVNRYTSDDLKIKTY